MELNKIGQAAGLSLLLVGCGDGKLNEQKDTDAYIKFQETCLDTDALHDKGGSKELQRLSQEFSKEINNPTLGLMCSDRGGVEGKVVRIVRK